MLGCNRVGTDGNGVQYSGDSLIVDYLGQAVADQAVAQPAVLCATLDYAQLKQYRQQFPAHLDADAFVLS